MPKATATAAVALPGLDLDLDEYLKRKERAGLVGESYLDDEEQVHSLRSSLHVLVLVCPNSSTLLSLLPQNNVSEDESEREYNAIASGHRYATCSAPVPRYGRMGGSYGAAPATRTFSPVRGEPSR